MAKLSKYTQAQSIVATNSIINDLNSPYSFKEWVERSTGILPDQEKVQYENYVHQWYINKKEEIPTSTSVKEDYVNLLKQLTLAFKSEADAIWCSDIDFNNPEDLERVIPFYATKLKEIAIYLINKREAIRRARLKYNMSGTYSALERLFHEYLLKAFTKRTSIGNEYTTNITDLSVLNAIPELSAVRNDFQIFVEELYDDASYFDRDPTLPASAYFSFNSNVTTYLDSLNISPDQYEWLYGTGVSQLCADNPLLWSVDNVLNQYKNGIPLSAVELYDSDVLNDYNRIKLTKKYIGEQQYILSGGYWIPWTDTVEYNFNEGNNWFYWLSGENAFENDTSTIIDAIPLSASQLIDSMATAGETLTASDRIFITRDNSLSGAWLSMRDIITFNTMMSARLDKGKTVFAFPFPGYGLSGEDLLWTGKSLNNLDRTFFYLDKETQLLVYQTYWNSLVSSTSSFNEVYLNDTTLVEAGAHAAEKFSDADYITTRVSFSDDIKDNVFTGQQNYAWLYKINKSDLYIKPGDNNICWPFEVYDTNVVTSLKNKPCESVYLSSIDIQNFAGSIAGNNIDTADKIFKKTSANSTNYIEGAWLSGSTYQQPSGVLDCYLLSGCYQPGLFTKVNGGAYGSFIWTDDVISANEVFHNIHHQSDCEYLKEGQFSLNKELPSQNRNLNYNQWQNCTCRSILYSPLGHPGSAFDDYNGMADFIVAITTPVSSFSFKDWKGIDGKNYKESNEFGWFKLDNQYKIEPDVGWGSGSWVTNTNSPFMLSSNVLYAYYRNNMLRDTPETTVPYLVIKHKNNNIRNEWVKLYYDKNTEAWKDAGVITDMVFNPGDILYYNHASTYAVTLTSSHYVFTEQEVPILPDFNNFSLNSTIGESNIPVSTVSQPIQAIDDAHTTGTTVAFVTVGTVSSYYYDMPTGDININVSFSNPFSSTVYSTISTITSLQTDYFTYTNEAISFMLNIPLSGWNYDISEYDGISQGARPFWVDATDLENEDTHQKGINIWSGSTVLVDDYTFKSQPVYSKMSFKDNSYFEYNKRNIGSIIWKQPVTVNQEVNEKKWCKIIIDTNNVSNLSSVLFNNINALIISATNIPSDIVLDIKQDKPLLVNYFAKNAFTWTQDISNSSLGLPPTGGVWVPIISGNLVTPETPYAHLSNRHYPTYASAPTIGELYSEKDSGGFMIPRLLGASTAISKNRISELDTSKIDNDQSLRGTTAIYRDIDIYNSDRGLSLNDQIEPVNPVSIDTDWMKSLVTENQKAGIPFNARHHQTFMPYQTEYECKGTNNYGLYRQGEDSTDPWFGNFDTTWENDVEYPSNWRKQYDINGWYDKHDNHGLVVYDWKTDIFGNQYAILKQFYTNTPIYDKKHIIPGSLWTRDTRNIVYPASASLSEVFKHIPTSLSGIDLISLSNSTSGILDIDTWFDTLMIYTSSVLFFFHLNFDYDNGLIYSEANDINYILNTNSKFGGTWFFENEKKVTICTMLSCGNQIRPILRSLNLNTNQMSYLYNVTSNLTDMGSIALTSFEHPVITYDYVNKLYNISYIGYSHSKEGMYFTTLNIHDYGEYHDITNAKTIIPDA